MFCPHSAGWWWCPGAGRWSRHSRSTPAGNPSCSSRRRTSSASPALWQRSCTCDDSGTACTSRAPHAGCSCREGKCPADRARTPDRRTCGSWTTRRTSRSRPPPKRAPEFQLRDKTWIWCSESGALYDREKRNISRKCAKRYTYNIYRQILLVSESTYKILCSKHM